MAMRRWVALVFLLSLALSVHLPGRDFIPLSEIHPGMTGVGKTCMKGRDVVEFNFEVLGVLRNLTAGHNLVLIRLSSQWIDRTGVFAGMSGSPVYIQDRLLGAVAFSFPFSTEPVAGVTPFEEMKQLSQWENSGFAVSGIEILPTSFMDLRDMIATLMAPSDREPGVLPVSTAKPIMPDSKIIPIAVPLKISGSSQAALHRFRMVFQEMGFSPMFAGSFSSSGTGNRKSGPTEPLRPGQGITVNLIQGDLEVGAGGTVTEVDGDKVYAFGHKFFSIGSTSLPMHESEAITVLPNLNNSVLFSSTGAQVGTISQDRSAGIFGYLGRDPGTIPVEVTILGSDNGPEKYHFEVARDKVLSAFLVNFALYGFITADERTLGMMTVELNASLHLKDGEEINLRNIYSHPVNAPAQAAQYISLPLQYVMLSGFQELTLEKLEVSFRITEQLHTARLDDVWVSKKRVLPGDTVDFKITIFRENGRTENESFSITIPEDIPPGPMDIFIGDGTELSKLDQKLEPGLFMIYNPGQLVRALKQLRQNGTIYVKMYRKGEGIYSKGSHFPALPPSYLDIFKGDRAKGTNLPIQYIHYMEKSLGDKDYVVVGSKKFQLIVEPF